MRLFPPARSTAGGLGTGSVQGSQPGDPCGAGAACPATGVDHKYDTRRLLLAGKSLAPHASRGPLHCPPTPHQSRTRQASRFLSLHPHLQARLGTGALRAPPPTPLPLRVTVPGPEVGSQAAGWLRQAPGPSHATAGHRAQPRWSGDGPRDLCPLEGCTNKCTLAWGGFCAGRPPPRSLGPRFSPVPGSPSSRSPGAGRTARSISPPLH